MKRILLVSILALAAVISDNCGQSKSRNVTTETTTPRSVRDSAEGKRALRLDGGFIQYWNYMLESNWQNPFKPPRPHPYPIKWSELVIKMHEAGMKTIVIQQLEYKEKGNVDPARFYSITDGPTPKPKPEDPTEKILTAADDDKHKMEVFIGLLDDKDWNYDTPKKTPRELEVFLLDERNGVARRMTDLAQRVWDLYHARHISFKGWYIPIEMWNFYLDKGDVSQRKKKIGVLRKFLSKISNKCMELNRKDGVNRPVAIAPYFNPNLTNDPDQLAPPNVTEEIYAELLDGAGVNIVMLQDGVGARGLDPTSESLQQYFNAFRNASKRVKSPTIEFWADVETYLSKDQPTTTDNLKKQLAAECGYASRFIAWDFYHYMNPVVDDCCVNAQGNQVACKDELEAREICKDMYGTNIINTLMQARREFYDSYKQEFVAQDFQSPDCAR